MNRFYSSHRIKSLKVFFQKNYLSLLSPPLSDSDKSLQQQFCILGKNLDDKTCKDIYEFFEEELDELLDKVDEDGNVIAQILNLQYTGLIEAIDNHLELIPDRYSLSFPKELSKKVNLLNEVSQNYYFFQSNLVELQHSDVDSPMKDVLKNLVYTYNMLKDFYRVQYLKILNTTLGEVVFQNDFDSVAKNTMVVRSIEPVK